MAELLIRAGMDDAKALARILADRDAALAPLRVVADAHAMARSSEFATAASQAGAPLVADPQTFYLQDRQDSRDPWCALPFAVEHQLTSRDVMRDLDALIESVTEFQVHHGATCIVPPYFHLGRTEAGWVEAQTAVWRRARAVLRSLAVTLPVLAVVCVDWNHLRGHSAFHADGPLMAALRRLAPDEIALAASKSHVGARPQDRVLDLCAAITRLGGVAPVLAWQQGLLGEACVAAGAAGYESGIGRREALDMGAALSSHRTYDTGAPRQARAVFVKALMRSVPKKSLQALSEIPTIWPSMFCLDTGCCAPQGQTMLRDARAHSVRARRRSLAELTSVGRPDWRWGALADKAEVGLALANRINRRGQTARVDTRALDGMRLVASSQRHGDGRINIA